MCEWSVCLRFMRITLAENKKIQIFLTARFSVRVFLAFFYAQINENICFFFFKVRLLKRSLRRVLSRKLSCPEKSSPGRFVVNMYVCVSKIRQNKSVMLVVVSRYVIVIFVSKVCCEWVSEWVFGANSIPKSVDCIYIFCNRLLIVCKRNRPDFVNCQWTVRSDHVRQMMCVDGPPLRSFVTNSSIRTVSSVQWCLTAAGLVYQ